MSYIERYKQLLKAQDINYIVKGEVLFREYGQVIIPLGPVVSGKPKSDLELKKVLRALRGKLVWYSYFDADLKESKWYAVIKDKYLEIEEYKSSNTRNQIRKGLKNCMVRRITVDELINNGYNVFQRAVSRYNTQTIYTSEIDYTQKVLITKKFQDIIEYWGVFVNEEMIGYSVIYLYGNEEANISEIRIDPKYSKLYPSYALFHILSENYLKKRQFTLISDGFRNLVHKTNIQQMLISKFGFRKVYLKLNVKVRFPYNILIRLLFPIKNKINIPTAQAVFRLYEAKKRIP